jgi:thiamine kinase-like enzyme
MNINALKKYYDGDLILQTLKHYELLDISNPEFRVTRMLSGDLNRNYKLYDGTHTLLLKIFTENNILPVNRIQVFKMQEELAILGLAPTPFFLSESGNVYCEQWIDVAEGRRLTESSQQYMTAIDSLAEVLHSIHNSFVSAPLLDLEKHWRTYWQKIDSPSEQFTQQYQEAIEQWRFYKKFYRDDFVLCHNDLHLDHISYLNGPIFDWEYAGLGCRYFDIASCCAINNFTQDELHTLCSRYAHFANIDIDDLIKKVQETSKLVSFTNHLWAASLGV